MRQSMENSAIRLIAALHAASAGLSLLFLSLWAFWIVWLAISAPSTMSFPLALVWWMLWGLSGIAAASINLFHSVGALRSPDWRPVSYATILSVLIVIAFPPIWV